MTRLCLVIESDEYLCMHTRSQLEVLVGEILRGGDEN